MVMPSAQTCSQCGSGFTGSDCIEYPNLCPSCESEIPNDILLNLSIEDSPKEIYIPSEVIWSPDSNPCGNWKSYFKHKVYTDLDDVEFTNKEEMRNAGVLFWENYLQPKIKNEMLSDEYIKEGDKVVHEDKALAYAYWEYALDLHSTEHIKARILNRIKSERAFSMSAPLGRARMEKKSKFTKKIKGRMAWRKNKYFEALEDYLNSREKRHLSEK